jgi:acetyl esterase
MPLDPKAKELLDEVAGSGRPNAHLLPVEQARANFEALFAGLGHGPELHGEDDHAVPVDGAAILVRTYRPAPGTLPLVVYLHGGGWLLGSAGAYDVVCRQLAAASGCLVASVDYRLAPEHRFPAAVEDAWAATVWAHANADALGADAQRLAVAGDSAGGNLAAVVAQRARDRGTPPLRFQLLVYPVTTADPSTLDMAYEGFFLYRDELAWHLEHYLGPGADAMSPLVSPLAGDVAGLPPALILTAECDLLHAQAEAYARRLAEAGVSVELREAPGMIHGWFGLGSVFPVADEYMQIAGTALREALA